MRELTFIGFLRSYVKALSHCESTAITKLALEAIGQNSQLRAPLYLYALLTDKMSLLLKATEDTALGGSYRELFLQYGKEGMFEALQQQNELPMEYLKVWKSYCSRKQMPEIEQGLKQMQCDKVNRQNALQRAFSYLQNLQGGYPQQSVIYYGSNAIGRSSILMRIEQEAIQRKILCSHLEAIKGGEFTAEQVSTLKSLSESVGENIDGEVKISSRTYEDDLVDIFVELGKAAQLSSSAVCLFVDEIQYLPVKELTGLIMAIHRCNQLGLPLMFFCSGLPEVLKAVGNACSYSERLFKFESIGKS